MKPFRFRLQQILELRAAEEGQAQEAYAQALQQLEAYNARRREVEKAIADYLEQCRRECGQRTSSERLTQQRDTLTWLHNRLKDMAPEGERLEAQMQTKWREFITARQRREAIDKLQDRQEQSHSRDAARAEQLALDEIALLRDVAPSAPKLMSGGG